MNKVDVALQALDNLINIQAWDQALNQSSVACSEILWYLLEKGGFGTPYVENLVDLYNTCSRCVYYYNIPMYNYITMPANQWTPEKVIDFSNILHKSYQAIA